MASTRELADITAKNLVARWTSGDPSHPPVQELPYGNDRCALLGHFQPRQIRPSVAKPQFGYEPMVSTSVESHPLVQAKPGVRLGMRRAADAGVLGAGILSYREENPAELSTLFSTVAAFARSFCPLSDDDVALLTSLMRVRQFAPGEFFIKAGAPCTEFGFIVSGLFKAHGSNFEGLPYIVSFAGANWLITDYEAMAGGVPAYLTIQAMEPSVVAAISYEDWQGLLRRPGPWQEFMRRLMETLLFMLARRERQFLTMSAGDRYLAFLEEHKEIVPRIARQDIAAYLGITPSSLSRLAAKIQRDRRNKK